MSIRLLKPIVMAFSTGMLLASAISHAAKLPINTDAEAADTDAARAAYFMMRRSHPNDPNFDTANARYEAAKQFDAASKSSSATNFVQSVGHNEAWQSIGPSTIVGGQTPTNATPQSRSAVSGRVTSIAIDPIDNAVYAGGAQGGVWKTLDNGQSWTPLTDNLKSLAVGTVVVAPGGHPANQATLYLGTGEGNFSGDGYAGIGIYKSTDSGQTWQGPYGSAQFLSRAVDAIVVDSASPNHLLAGSSAGIYGISGTVPGSRAAVGVFVSNDGGLTWAPTFTTSPATPSYGFVSRIVQDPTTATTWWAAKTYSGNPSSATGGTLIKSTDNGATWVAVDGQATGLPIVGSNPIDGGFVRSWLSASTAAGKTVLYYATSEIPPSQQPPPGNGSYNGGKLFVSVDGGVTWIYQAAADGYCQGQCWYDMPVYTPPEASTTVYAGGAGSSGGLLPGGSSFIRSTDGGATFTDEMVAVDGNSALHADFHAITSWPGQPNNIWVGNDGGVFHSTDGGQHWLDANTSLQLTQFSGCDLHPTDPNAAYGGTQDNGTEAWLGDQGLPGLGGSWSHSDDGDGGFALIDQGAPANVAHTYYNLPNTQIFVTTATNGVASGPSDYQYAAGYIPGFENNGINGADNVLFYAPMQLDHGVTDTLYFGTDHLYIAPNFFNQAIAATNAAIGGPGSPQNPPPNPNYVVFTALNGGATLSPPIPPSTTTGAISAIQSVQNVLPGQPAKVIFVGTSDGHMWASTNSGSTFAPIDTASGQPAVRQYVSSIVTDPRNPNVVFESRAGFTGALPAHNVRRSTDGGTTWADASNGLPDIPVNAVIFDPTFPNQLWAGTDVGMYLSTNGGNTWIPYNQGVPNVAIFSLAANHRTHKILACTHGRGAFELNLDAIFIDGFDIY